MRQKQLVIAKWIAVLYFVLACAVAAQAGETL